MKIGICGAEGHFLRSFATWCSNREYEVSVVPVEDRGHDGVAELASWGTMPQVLVFVWGVDSPLKEGESLKEDEWLLEFDTEIEWHAFLLEAIIARFKRLPQAVVHVAPGAYWRDLNAVAQKDELYLDAWLAKTAASLQDYPDMAYLVVGSRPWFSKGTFYMNSASFNFRPYDDLLKGIIDVLTSAGR